MCGLVYEYRINKRAAKKVAKRYQAQKTRGTRGYGFLEIKDGQALDIKRATDEKSALDFLKVSEANEILFHHRTPTSTHNVLGATHPIYVSHDSLKYDYVGIHNGVIQNSEKIKKEHEAEGYTYQTIVKTQYVDNFKTYDGDTKFNDSESLIIELAKMIDTGGAKVATAGSIAFIIVQLDKDTGKRTGLFFGRNYGNPLVSRLTNEGLTLASEGDGTVVEPLFLWEYNYKKNELTKGRDITLPQTEWATTNYYGKNTNNYADDDYYAGWYGKDKKKEKELAEKPRMGFTTEKEKTKAVTTYEPLATITENGTKVSFYTLEQFDFHYTQKKQELTDWQGWALEAAARNDLETARECELNIEDILLEIEDYETIKKELYDEAYT